MKREQRLLWLLLIAATGTAAQSPGDRRMACASGG